MAAPHTPLRPSAPPLLCPEAELGNKKIYPGFISKNN